MLTYRPDIDGLRAIAVLSVVIYHLDESLLSGGFVGVDIFFVISGYLITKLIAKELQQTGQFSYKNFYIRRVRRLFPALFATLALSGLAAAWLLSPAHLVEFAESSIAAIFSVSNIYFWNAVDYFDSESQLKPLLHTWSLSVEEQFYLIWPALLAALFAVRRSWVIPTFIVGMGVASLVLNIMVFANQSEIAAWFGSENNQSTFSAQATAFYWLPFRVYEFAIGALLVFLPPLAPRARYLANELCFIVGLGMVLYSVIFLNSKLDFPSTAALWPCVGAALMMIAGPQHRLAWIVSNRAAVGVGLSSYSLYLVHWPIIVFFKYQNYSDPTPLEQVGIAAASVLIAALFYKFVEQPFRKPQNSKQRPHRKFLLASAFAALALVCVNLHASWSGGWLSRYPKDVIAQLSYKKGDYSEYFWRSFFSLEKEFADTGKAKVVVIGDSMAADFVNVLVEGGHQNSLDLVTIPIGDNCKVAFPLSNEQYSTLFGGAADLCRQQHEKVLTNTKLLEQADTIVLASYWFENHWQPYVQSTVDYLAGVTDARILVSGLKDQVSNGIWFINKHAFAPGVHTLRTPASPHVLHVNRRLQASAQNYVYFDLLDRFCNEEGCQRVTQDGYAIIFDQSHFSEWGARFVGQKITDTDWFKLLTTPSTPLNENTESLQ